MSAPGVPMTMEDWQVRMRAQKEEERRKKTESEEILRGYRGGVKEEDLKLKALREEDRKKQLDAERNLHNYRGIVEEGKEKPARKQHDYPPVSARQEDDIAFGSVSALAANFDSPQRSDDFLGSGGVHRTQNALAFPSDEAAAELTEHFRADELEQEDYDDDIDEEEKKFDEAEPTAAPAKDEIHDHPTVVRLDVSFSFGLITATNKPILDGYMMAVEAIVRKTLREEHFLGEHVTYNPSFGPFVQDCQWDDSFTDPLRPGVKRALVVASVPVFLGNGISIHIARDAIVDALEKSIQSGTFLALAQGSSNYFFG